MPVQKRALLAGALAAVLAAALAAALAVIACNELRQNGLGARLNYCTKVENTRSREKNSGRACTESGPRLLLRLLLYILLHLLL